LRDWTFDEPRVRIVIAEAVDTCEDGEGPTPAR
jgi:hypothetical protein